MEAAASLLGRSTVLGRNIPLGRRTPLCRSFRWATAHRWAADKVSPEPGCSPGLRRQAVFPETFHRNAEMAPMVAYALPQPLELPLPVGSLGGAEWWPMAADGTAARAMASS
jgi:hypothetical protein